MRNYRIRLTFQKCKSVSQSIVRVSGESSVIVYEYFISLQIRLQLLAGLLRDQLQDRALAEQTVVEFQSLLSEEGRKLLHVISFI